MTEITATSPVASEAEEEGVPPIPDSSSAIFTGIIPSYGGKWYAQ
jgi:hypothetical protein